MCIRDSNGAADLIFRAVLAKKPKKALLPAPAFAEYEAALTACGCQVEYYFLREENDFRLDEGFLQAIVPGIDMVFVCEPNNPTGVSSPREFLLRVAEQLSLIHIFCISAICIETLYQAVKALQNRGIQPEVTQISISRGKAAGSLHLLMANNPIFLIAGNCDG